MRKEKHACFWVYSLFAVSTCSSNAQPMVVDLNSLSLSKGFKLTSTSSVTAVSAAGDVNGDGFDDVLVGAANLGAGVAYVVFGRSYGDGAFTNIALSTLTTGSNLGFRILGVTSGDKTGFSVSRAGDVNGDGIDDLLVGAYSANPPPIGATARPGAGITYVVFGRSYQNGAASYSSISLASFATGSSLGYRIFGHYYSVGAFSGWSVSGAGDVNGDGLADVIVGAFRGDGAGAFVVFGRSGAAANATVDLSTFTTGSSVGFRILCADSGDQSGFSVSGAGDFNGDGLDDVIVGGYQPSGAGISYVVFGRRVTSGASSYANVQLSNMASTSTALGYSIRGYSSNDYAGWSVGRAGDVNGDGVQDIIVGAHRAESPVVPESLVRNECGITYVVFGRRTGNSNINLGSLTSGSAIGYRIVGALATDWSGFWVSAAGDFNRDGLDDVLLSANKRSVSYLVYGRNTTGGGAASFASIDLANFTSNLGFSIVGTKDFVSIAGDVNADEGHDIIVAAGSSAYVIFGSAPAAPTSQPSSQPSSRPSTQPASRPTNQPSDQPSNQPTLQPFSAPTVHPSNQPSSQPSRQPNVYPTARPTAQPTLQPSSQPRALPTALPTSQPSAIPSSQPSREPSAIPSSQPSSKPSNAPAAQPSHQLMQMPSSQPSAEPTACPSTHPTSPPSSYPFSRPSASSSAQPSVQPTCIPSIQPRVCPSAQTSAQPTLAPTPRLKLSSGEWVTNLAEAVLWDITWLNGSIWVCGGTGGDKRRGECTILDALTGSPVELYTFGFKEKIVSLLEVHSVGGEMYIHGCTSSGTVDGPAIANTVSVCRRAQSELVCTTKTFFNTNYVSSAFSEYTHRVLFVGQEGLRPIATIFDTTKSLTVRSYHYTTTALKTMSILHTATVSHFVGSMVAGTGVSTGNTNVILAGWISLKTGGLAAMTLTPTIGRIISSVNLVTALVLDDTGPDSFMVGGVELSVDSAGTCAYLLRANALYRTVRFAVRYRRKASSLTSSGSGRRSLRGAFVPNGVSRGIVRMGDNLFIISDYTQSLGNTSLVLIQADIESGDIVQQATISSHNASILCTNIIATTEHSLSILCSVVGITSTTQAVVISVNQKLSFSRLPTGFVMHSNVTYYTERIAWKAAHLLATSQGADLRTIDTTFVTGNQMPTRMPSTIPSAAPSALPTTVPSTQPSSSPTSAPSVSARPTSQPSTSAPSITYRPTAEPTIKPTARPTATSTVLPTLLPTIQPSTRPSPEMTPSPTAAPSAVPSSWPHVKAKPEQTASPSPVPTARPTRGSPTTRPTTVATSVQQGFTASSSKASDTSSVIYIAVGSFGAVLCLLFCGGIMWGQYNKFKSRSEKRKRRRAYDNAYAALKPPWFLRLTSLMCPKFTKSLDPEYFGMCGSGNNDIRELKTFGPKEKEIASKQDTHRTVHLSGAVSACVGGPGQTSVVDPRAGAVQVAADRVNSADSCTEVLLQAKSSQSSASTDDDIFDEIMRDGSEEYSDNDQWSVSGEESERIE